MTALTLRCQRDARTGWEEPPGGLSRFGLMDDRLRVHVDRTHVDGTHVDGTHVDGTHKEECLMKLSARNQIPARITAINSGEAIANVELDAGGVRLVASITVEAVRQLGLTEGSQVIAVVKASDVMVATAD